jgi:Domain of unknown function (DUF4160)
MPTISVFYGLIVMLYFFDDERHHLPHIHVRYQDSEASFSILDGSLLAGNLPVAKLRLMQAWIEIHREDLMANWQLASIGEKPFPVEPLR